MKRTKQAKRPTAILTGDWHLRETQPIARTDDFWTAQWDKVRQIRELQEKHGCPVWTSGDTFQHWKPSPYLLTEAIAQLPKEMSGIAGNHDLPQHNIDLIGKSGLQTLVEAGKIQLLSECHWGDEPRDGSFLVPILPTAQETLLWRKILIWHVMTFVGGLPWPGCTDMNAKQILEKYPEYNLILTGHNHSTFVEEVDGRILVNPGSITRQTSAQTKQKPCVFLWYAKDNSVEQVFLDIPAGVISREHIEKTEKRDARINAFVEKLSGDWKVVVSFEENLQRFLETNEIRKSVKSIILESIEQ